MCAVENKYGELGYPPPEKEILFVAARGPVGKGLHVTDPKYADELLKITEEARK